MTSLERLGTYIDWPANSPVSCFSLASSGFVYTGVSDQVKCPLCELVVDNWTQRSLSPLDEHRLGSPYCPFFIESSSNNGSRQGGLISSTATASAMASGDLGSIVPATEIDRANPNYDLLKYESVRLSTFHDWPVSMMVQPSALARAGLFYTGQSDRTRCAFCRGVLHHWERTDYPDIKHFCSFPQCPYELKLDVGNVPLQRDSQQGSLLSSTATTTAMTSGDLGSIIPTAEIDRANPNYDMLKYESVRLSTFHDWPVSAMVQPSALARAGFFYTGQSDRTCCAFCRGVLHHWEQRDDPDIEHFAYFLQCPFVRRRDVGNVPLQRDSQRSGIESSTATTAMTSDDLGSITPAAEINRANPIYDLLRYESVRLSTFHDWPVSAMVQPSALARAGLFYTGESDRTRCAFCRGVLHHWEPRDDPDIEHFCYFPQCPFMRQRDVGNVPLQRDSSPTAVTQPVTYLPSNSTELLSGKSEPNTTSANITAGEDEDRFLNIFMCKICMEYGVDILFLPCRHLISCKQCARKLNKCAICRTYIRGRIGIFLS